MGYSVFITHYHGSAHFLTKKWTATELQKKKKWNGPQQYLAAVRSVSVRCGPAAGHKWWAGWCSAVLPVLANGCCWMDGWLNESFALRHNMAGHCRAEGKPSNCGPMLNHFSIHVLWSLKINFYWFSDLGFIDLCERWLLLTLLSLPSLPFSLSEFVNYHSVFLLTCTHAFSGEKASQSLH